MYVRLRSGLVSTVDNISLFLLDATSYERIAIAIIGRGG